jgi:hypothetical protein
VAQGYEASKQKQHVLDLIKWGADYLIKCHVEKDKFVAQVRTRPCCTAAG